MLLALGLEVRTFGLTVRALDHYGHGCWQVSTPRLVVRAPASPRFIWIL